MTRNRGTHTARADRLGHAAERLHLVDDGARALAQVISQRLDQVGASERVHHLGNAAGGMSDEFQLFSLSCPNIDTAHLSSCRMSCVLRAMRAENSVGRPIASVHGVKKKFGSC